MMKAQMSIKSSIDELSNQIQSNFPSHKSANPETIPENFINTIHNEENEKPKPYKEQLDIVQPQQKICSYIKENSQQNSYCKDNYKLSIDKNIECITSFCFECCSKQSPEIEMNDCKDICNKSHPKSNNFQDQDRELSKLCSKNEVVSKNIDFCKIVKGTTSTDFDNVYNKQKGDLEDETQTKCQERLCDDCCDKELNTTRDSNDKYYIACRESCYNQSGAQLKNNQQQNQFNKGALDLNKIDENITLKDGMRKINEPVNKLIQQSKLLRDNNDFDNNIRSQQSITNLNNHLRDQINTEKINVENNYESKSNKSKVLTFKFKDIDQLKGTKTLKINLNKNTKSNLDDESLQAHQDQSVVENMQDNDNQTSKLTTVKLHTINGTHITNPLDNPSPNTDLNDLKSSSTDASNDPINTNQLINIIPNQHAIHVSPSNSHLINDLSNLVCKYDTTKHINLCLKDSKGNCVDSQCDTCCTRFQNATNEVIIYKPCYDNCTSKQPSGIDIIQSLQDSIFTVCFAGSYDCGSRKCNQLCDIKGFNQQYTSNSECTDKCVEGFKLKTDINQDSVSTDNKPKTTMLDIDNVLNIYNAIHDASYSNPNNNKHATNIKYQSDVEFQKTIGSQDDRLVQLKNMVSRVEQSMLDMIKSRGNTPDESSTNNKDNQGPKHQIVQDNRHKQKIVGNEFNSNQIETKLGINTNTTKNNELIDEDQNDEDMQS